MRLLNRRRWQRAGVFGTTLLLMAGSGVAATAPLSVSGPVQASSAIAAPIELGEGVALVGINGFRSAHFGMSEDDVRAAIVRDFAVKPRDIVAGLNAAERTQLLTIRVPDVLPGGGTATVSYVFGYATRTLIQVGVLWSAATDSSLTAAKLSASGEALRSRLIAAGYKPGTIKTDLLLPNGLLLFRGEDGAGHATILMFEGNFATAAGTRQKSFTPTSLSLLNSANPQHPDVFRVAPGSF